MVAGSRKRTGRSKEVYGTKGKDHRRKVRMTIMYTNVDGMLKKEKNESKDYVKEKELDIVCLN